MRVFVGRCLSAEKAGSYWRAPLSTDKYQLANYHCVTKKFDISGKHTKLWFLGVVFGAESESAIVFFLSRQVFMLFAF